MKNGTEIAYTYATTVKVAKQLAEEIDQAISAAVQAEREACAMIAETTPLSFYDTKTQREIAAAIRARGK